MPVDSVVPGARDISGSAEQPPQVQLGQLVATRAIDEWLMSHDSGSWFVLMCLRRHERGDWGVLHSHDASANDAALLNGARILSSYSIPQQLLAGSVDERLWIITEAEDSRGVRSHTTVLFPSDY